MVAAMPTPRDNPMGAALNGRFYVCGGRNSSTIALVLLDVVYF